MTLTNTSTPAAGNATLMRATLSEVIKLATLLSNKILAGIALLMIAGSGALSALALTTRASNPKFAQETITANPLQFVDSVLWAQVIIAILAVLSVTNEYVSGQIKLSLLATPTRIPVLAAKTIAVASVAFVIGAVGALLSLSISLPIIGSTRIVYNLDPGVAVGLILGSGIYLAAIAILSTGLAMILRNVIAALAVTIPLITILPAILSSIPIEPVREAVSFFPTIAGRMIISNMNTSVPLTPWGGYCVLLAWAAIAWALAAFLLWRRDA
ncbi:hypothetical protein [Glaciihabitans sp. UYNi722]|uniref:hypothetical protein n=1 Tax=Glaciihabitans sp. UYNi722 TaxID=3156344 RepID=UPI00339533C6